MSVLVLEKNNAPFSRATYINQTRVHQGYHYPRSISAVEAYISFILSEGWGMISKRQRTMISDCGIRPHSLYSQENRIAI